MNSDTITIIWETALEELQQKKQVFIEFLSTSLVPNTNYCNSTLELIDPSPASKESDIQEGIEILLNKSCNAIKTVNESN